MRTSSLLIGLFVITFITGVIGLELIILDSGIPVILMLAFAVVFTSLISMFVVLSRNPKETKQDDNEIKDLVESELKVIANSAEKSVDTINDLKYELRDLKNYFNQPTLVASKLSNKFHKPECRFARHISKENQVWFRNQNDAARQGFKPCHLM